MSRRVEPPYREERARVVRIEKVPDAWDRTRPPLRVVHLDLLLCGAPAAPVIEHAVDRIRPGTELRVLIEETDPPHRTCRMLGIWLGRELVWWWDDPERLRRQGVPI